MEKGCVIASSDGKFRIVANKSELRKEEKLVLKREFRISLFPTKSIKDDYDKEYDSFDTFFAMKKCKSLAGAA